MNSRQNLRPVGTDRWIIRTAQAIKKATSDNHVVVTSVGMTSWEISLYFAAKDNTDLTLYVPVEINSVPELLKSYYIEQFRLSDNQIDWRFIKIDDLRKDYDRFQNIRDEQIINQADLIYPVAIRPDGNLERLLESAARSGTEINENYRCEYETSQRSYKYDIESDLINPELDRLASNCIIHWTRASNFPWPGESRFDYYDGIVKSSGRYPRDALSTLIHILSEKRLRASSRHYRKNITAVSFSSLPASEVSKLMRWRARYREMSFEPYGIGIEKKAADRLRIRKVLYGSPEMYRYLDRDDQPYFQSIGSRGFWLPEREYRFLGDLDLELLDKKDIIVIVWKPDEVSLAKSIYDGQVVSFYK